MIISTADIYTYTNCLEYCIPAGHGYITYEEDIDYYFYGIVISITIIVCIIISMQRARFELRRRLRQTTKQGNARMPRAPN